MKTEVKKEEPEEENRKENNEEEDNKDGPCTKMTMRLRRNLNNPQCVSTPQDAHRMAAKVEFSITKLSLKLETIIFRNLGKK